MCLVERHPEGVTFYPGRVSKGDRQKRLKKIKKVQRPDPGPQEVALGQDYHIPQVIEFVLPWGRVQSLTRRASSTP
jgi:hypothetical protein